MFFRRLCDLREDHDLSQKAVAEFLNMQPNVYRRYERGQREIPVWALVKLAEFYRTSTDYIVGLTDDPAPCSRR